TLQDVRYAKELLEELQLGDRVNHIFDMLSKGQRQNVLIARALFADPEILILDEPCTGLDIYNRSYLFRTIEALSKRKKLTILYVTHYVEEILPMFEKTLLLRSGHIFAQGQTEELLNSETMKSFLGYDVDIQKVNGAYNLHVQADSSMIDLLMRGNENDNNRS
ncbi:MAG: ATP-binding cassette domain-containing protein, partial [Peptococcaceae bacterium]|nr:ATP-binding cassette domain-containing protein [Peptococcaceae bacterium]